MKRIYLKSFNTHVVQWPSNGSSKSPFLRNTKRIAKTKPTKVVNPKKKPDQNVILADFCITLLIPIVQFWLGGPFET